MEKGRFRLGIKMNYTDKEKNIPEEFKDIAKDFS